MNKLFFILYVFAAVQISQNEDVHATPLKELIHITEKKLDKLWDGLSESNSINAPTLTRDELLRFFLKLDEKISFVEVGLSREDYQRMLNFWTYRQADASIKNINAYYDTFKRFLDEWMRGKLHADLAWTDLAETYLQDNVFGLLEIMKKLHRHVIESDPLTLFEQALQEFKTIICDMKESAHQGIYNLYNTVTLADYKGHLMLQFSYIVLKLYKKGNFTTESNLERIRFEKRIDEKANAVRNTLANADRSAYNCDPEQHVEGVTYVKITKLLRGYIENEVNLNPYGTCRENCAYYYYTEYNGCYKEEFCNYQEQCRGKVVECKYVDSDMNICKSSNPERRYDWVEYENGRILGSKGRCLNRNLFKVDSWWRYLFWHCSYCLCLCDEASYNSDRYFNLRSTTSDIDKNKVVTGVKFTKHNGIIHLQIQQSVLRPYGITDKSSTSWKPIDNYTITDPNVHNGIDYHTMNWLNRAIDLDDVAGDVKQVLTGVRFRKVGNHLNLEVRVTPFNFTSGKVSTEVHSTWLSNDNTEVSLTKPRKEIFLTNPDIPIRNGPHIKDSEHNQFIKLQATSFESDVAQSTVPFFDSQPITSHGFPLSGFGLIYKGKPGSGGFIAPKLISYDFGSHI